MIFTILMYYKSPVLKCKRACVNATNLGGVCATGIG